MQGQMKAALVLMLLLVVVCAFISLRLLNFSVLYENLFMVSSTRMFRYSVFNSIIFVILVRSFRSAASGVDEFLPFAELLSEELKYATEDSNEQDDDDSHCASGGYEGDNDDEDDDDGHSEMSYIEDDKETADNDSKNKVEAEQETASDHDFDNKAEAFISKVIQGWKKELMMDKLTMNI
ncbi:hypothetical protein POM88_030952 [Heracleum sosnowskyi]|uniref:Uncharacterized protein n=1 Tax=Heracleum sosnowskyi TaxID=360622 RepID=A0AAD8HXR4_9APIA|nr:hypothetical protein POM88_030952 [Heracleum sosnowskyi]